MSISYPRALPAFIRPTRASRLRLDRFEDLSRNLGGQVFVQEIAPARWRIDIATQGLSASESIQLDAWIESLSVGRTFLAGHPANCLPQSIWGTGFAGLLQHGGSTPFDGTASVDDVTATTIALADLPSTFALEAGDLIGLVESGVYGLFQILEDVSASSGAATVTVEPNINLSLFSDSAVAQLSAPKAEFHLEPGSYESAGVRRLGASFSGVQKLQ